ncbi:MAG: FG-GAP-like repeat-containing protein [Bifidobacteriaceae bacterium]|jgi:alpha-tubulin suppressor-like RCC1 family protein|nr:FG-GAP-like repeat-containing protein [Bifidobacteriaceae bacterium]
MSFRLSVLVSGAALAGLLIPSGVAPVPSGAFPPDLVDDAASAVTSPGSSSVSPETPTTDQATTDLTTGDETDAASGDEATASGSETKQEDLTFDRTVEPLVGGMVQVTAGGMFTLALADNGRVYRWGDQNAGLMTGVPRPTWATPHLIEGALADVKVVAIAAGRYISLALSDTGQVYTMNDYWYCATAQDPNDDNCAAPVLVRGALSGVRIVAVAAGEEFALALSQDGRVFSWGENNYGQLGDGTTINRITPVLVSGLSGQRVVGIAAGSTHCAAVTSTGAVYTWGTNTTGALGDGTTTSRTSPVKVNGALNGQNVKAVAAGAEFTAALTTGGRVYTWGSNYRGQVGVGDRTDHLTPVLVGGALTGVNITGIVAAGGHTVALSQAGRVYSWGYNAFGEVGVGDTLPRLEPVRLDGILSNVTITAIGVGDYSTVVASNSGKLYLWGTNYYGQIGTPIPPIQALPVAVTGLPSNSPVVAIAAQHDFTMALTAAGQVYTWGNNENQHIGDGTAVNRFSPVLISGALSGVKIVAIATGVDHAMALSANGQVYTWGHNTYGQLGDPGRTAVTPARVDGPLAGLKVVGIAAGDYFNLVVTDTGRVYAWGANASGQLGNGSTTRTGTPTLVGGLLAGVNVATVATGASVSIAISQTGKGYIWGVNATGQLGNGNLTNNPLPAAMTGVFANTSVKAASGGNNHTVATTRDGKFYTWGGNMWGQLGNGTQTDQTTPAPPAGPLANLKVTAVSAGYNHTVAVTDSGRVYTVGYNAYGRLGDGTTALRSTPVLVGGLLTNLKVVAVAAGREHTVALTDTGRVYTWGDNDYGQLGTAVAGHYPWPEPLANFDLRTPPASAGSVTISGTPRTGNTLTATASDVAPANAQLSYQWLRGGTALSGATAGTYTVAPGDVGQVLTVRVTASKTGFTTGSAVSAPITGQIGLFTSVSVSTCAQPAVSAACAAVISATPGMGSAVYQWLINGAAVSGATGSSYRPTPADAGKNLSVRASVTRPGFETRTVTSTTRQVPIPPADSMLAFTLSPDLSGDRLGDVVGVHTSGELRLFKGGASGFSTSFTRPGVSGVAGVRVFGPGDWSGDGRSDVATIDTAGDLWLYRGDGKGSLSTARVKLGNGWNSFLAVPSGDLTGDGQPDLLGVDLSTGLLYLYRWNVARGWFETKRQVGNGWTGWDLYAAGDLNGDGRTDVLGIDSTGNMFCYHGKGDGTFQTKRQCGNGWGSFQLAAGADLTGDGLADIIGRDNQSRAVYFYRGLGAGRFATKRQVTSGW